jgi:hypothetical protein
LVPRQVWEYYVPAMVRRRLLCPACWQTLVNLIDGGTYARAHAYVRYKPWITRSLRPADHLPISGREPRVDRAERL